MKIKIGDYRFKIHWTRMIAAAALLYLFLSGTLGHLFSDCGTTLQAAWHRYGRFVETHDSVVKLMTLCVFLVALTLTVRIFFWEGHSGH